jgi:hypothetical protein
MVHFVYTIVCPSFYMTFKTLFSPEIDSKPQNLKFQDLSAYQQVMIKNKFNPELIIDENI